MLAPEENLSVMRVQEGLRRLGYDAGDLDGVFGNATGAAVTAFKIDNALSRLILSWDRAHQRNSMTCCSKIRFSTRISGELSGFVAARNSNRSSVCSWPTS